MFQKLIDALSILSSSKMPNKSINFAPVIEALVSKKMSRTRKVLFSLSTIALVSSLCIILLWQSGNVIPYQVDLPMHVGIIIAAMGSNLLLLRDVKMLCGQHLTRVEKLKGILFSILVLAIMFVPAISIFNWTFDNHIDDGKAVFYWNWLGFSIYAFSYFTLAPILLKHTRMNVTF